MACPARRHNPNKLQRATMCPNDLIARLVPERFRLQAIRQTSMRGWARRKPATSRQENRRHRRADRAPVREQRVVGTATVFILPDDILQNTVRAFSVSATSPTGYSALGAPTGRDIAPANGPLHRNGAGLRTAVSAASWSTHRAWFVLICWRVRW
jgi:hypothetical protein